jgi:hypothetical protein
LVATLQHLKDPSITTEVYCLRALQTKEELLTKRKRDLEDVKARIDGLQHSYQAKESATELQWTNIYHQLTRAHTHTQIITALSILQ